VSQTSPLAAHRHFRQPPGLLRRSIPQMEEFTDRYHCRKNGTVMYPAEPYPVVGIRAR
jgi:hypothetical protein